MSDLTVETAKELVVKVREALNSIDYDGEVSFGFYFGDNTKVVGEIEVTGTSYLDMGSIWVEGQEPLRWDNSNTGN